ncbi:hypothetical protein STEG23_011160 [Scotinomys teguina]
MGSQSFQFSKTEHVNGERTKGFRRPSVLTKNQLRASQTCHTKKRDPSSNKQKPPMEIVLMIRDNDKVVMEMPYKGVHTAILMYAAIYTEINYLEAIFLKNTDFLSLKPINLRDENS